MEKIGIAQAKALLPQLLGKLGRGELDGVVITRSGRPVAKLIPIAAVEQKRVGVAKGIFEMLDEHRCTSTLSLRALTNHSTGPTQKAAQSG